MEQIALLDLPAVETLRRRVPKQPAEPTPQREETIHQTLKRYAREAAEIRVELRRQGKIGLPLLEGLGGGEGRGVNEVTL